MSDRTEAFQISAEAAEAYEARFVPALFASWSEEVVGTAGLRAGQDVLDVACGTGVVARAVADRLAGSGRVVGLDLNPAMLAVAARLRPDIDWREGDVASLPFGGASFDLVTCQAALMFFRDPVQALREMSRVARPGGALVILVPGRFESSPAYVRLAEVAAEYAPGAADLFQTYFVHGDLPELARLFARAGLQVETTRSDMRHVVFGSLDDFVATEVGATPLAEQIDAATYRRLLADAHEALAEYVTPDGRSRIPIESHVVRAFLPTDEKSRHIDNPARQEPTAQSHHR